jgi:hypothetical protein
VSGDLVLPGDPADLGRPPGAPNRASTSWAPVDLAELNDLVATTGLLTRDQLARLPPVQPLISETLDRGTFALLAGYWGTGKSFVALDWTCSVITGKPWQSRPIVDRAGAPIDRDGERRARPYHALYVAAEGAYGIRQRVEAWEHGWHAEANRLYVLPTQFNLRHAGELDTVARLIRALRVDFVVLDTLSRCMPGADENSAQDMSTAVLAIDKLKAATNGGTVLAVHHTGKDKVTVRGSSVLEAAADTVYQIEGDPSLMRLTRTKRKDGPTDDMHQLSLSRVLESCVVADVRGQNQVPSWDRLYRVVADNFADTGATKVELRNVADMPPASFHRALNALVGNGDLINEGTDQRPFYRLAKRGDDDVR